MIGRQKYQVDDAKESQASACSTPASYYLPVSSGTAHNVLRNRIGVMWAIRAVSG